MATKQSPVTLIGLSFNEFPHQGLSEQQLNEVSVAGMNGSLTTIHELKTTTEHTYQTLKDFIGNIVDIAYMQLGGKRVGIFCDDEGLLASGLCLGWNINTDDGMNVKLMGPIIFCDEATDEHGYTLSSPLSAGEVRELMIKQQLQPFVAKLN